MKPKFQRLALVCAMLFLFAMASAYAQSGQRASGTLVVSMQVQSSISLVSWNSILNMEEVRRGAVD